MGFLDKLCPREQLAARLAALPRPLVFTNGVFDILHRGHVSYLAQARELGGSLVIGLNSDASARLLGEVRADLYVKGGDYDMETLEETRLVRSWGGQALAIPFVDGYSTTALVKRIRA